MTVKAKAMKAASPEVRNCQFCKREDRLSLVRLIVGNESRLVWVCPDHRG